METYIEGSRIDPEDWIPLLLNVYDTLSSIVQEFGVWITVVGAGAYAIHVEPFCLLYNSSVFLDTFNHFLSTLRFIFCVNKYLFLEPMRGFIHP